jgi:type II secretory pathway pseudopilin PulG
MSKETKRGFTIIELLTVLTIIIIIISLLVPGLQAARRYAKYAVQKSQFHEISKGLELYRHDHGDTLPDSGSTDASTSPASIGYCGAMKLCEAMVGQDGMGFHPSSRFFADGTAIEPNGATVDLYRFDLCNPIDPANYQPEDLTNMRDRIKYADVETIKANRLQDLYNWPVSNGTNFGTIPFKDNPAVYPNAIISDVFLRASIKATSCAQRAGKNAGMPVLYYKADPSKLSHDVNDVFNPDNIYNFDDNYAITMLGSPGESAMNVKPHPMFSDPRIFYKETKNDKVTSTSKPHNEGEYILISAGWDGMYGTGDDVFNFAQ